LGPQSSPQIDATASECERFWYTLSSTISGYHRASFITYSVFFVDIVLFCWSRPSWHSL